MPDKFKMYTTTGDDGTTGLLGNARVKKYHPRPEAYGHVDETQAAMGMARAVMQDSQAGEVILKAQRDLYSLMSELAATRDAAEQFRTITTDSVTWLEERTDAFTAKITLPREFTVSGDSVPGAALDYARTVCRRAERHVVRLLDEGYIENAELVRYLNRLSSLLFVLSRYEDAVSGQSSVRLAKE